MKHYYNEFDAKAAAWLRELMRAGLIPEGYVDERDIHQVQASDLAGYTVCHFFAGIGGWPYALRLADWPAERPVWTGSCPCQPFSSAGKGEGQADKRHLWPDMYRLIAECRPPTIFGEQVAAAIRHGWLDGVCADLEGAEYACGAHVLGAHSVGAPHIRQRLFWVADANGTGQRPSGWAVRDERNDPRRGGEVGGLGDTILTRLERHARHGDDGNEPGRLAAGEAGSAATASTVNFWSYFDLIPCRDGKARRVKPGVRCLVDGFPERPSLLRGYGNAIVPQVAAEFVKAYLAAEARP